MIGQIIVTVFIAWFLIGLMLLSIGSFINGCTRYLTKIDEIGCGLLGVLLGIVAISLIVGLIILIWS